MMSEYRVYEFLAIDRPLMSEELAYVRSLSRRVQPTATQAMFTYSYGGFPGDPLDLLAKHYDLMVYVANWGSAQLAFRLPKKAVDRDVLLYYSFAVEEIELTEVGQYLILNIAFHEEESAGWVEEEGYLAPLVPLRADLLGGDLRALYLVWLASAERQLGGPGEDEDQDADELIEPPVPPGLGQLSAPLQALMEFFAIDQDLGAAAATASPALRAADEPLERWAGLLSEAERTSFLVRAARGEPIGAELLRRLRAVGGGQRPSASPPQQRTFRSIREVARTLRRKRENAEREAVEHKRLAALGALAQRAEQVWSQIPELLALRTAKGYDQAVAHLVELRDLAEHRNQRAAFDARLSELLGAHPASPALGRRLREQRLVS